MSELHSCTVEQFRRVLLTKDPGIQAAHGCHAQYQQGPAEQAIKFSAGKECQCVDELPVVVFPVAISDACWRGGISV